MESRDLHAVTQGDAGRAAQYRLRVISTHFTQSAAPSSHWAHAGSPLQPPNIEPPQLLKITKVGPKSGHAGPPIVVGGMVLDVLAVPDEKSSIAAGTTVPGKIKQAPGGVGRNIAQCIAALASESSSEPPLIISVVGRDPAGDALVGHLSRLGIPDRGVRRSSTASTAAVAVVFGSGGEVEAAVADVGILDDEHESTLQTSWIQGFVEDISAAPIMVVDANLHEATLRAAVDIAAKAGVPVWFEPVSVAKSKRAAAVFSGITVVSPNQNELKAMAEATGRCRVGSSAAASSESQQWISRSNDVGSGVVGASGAAEEELRALAPYAEAVLDAGVKHIVLTLGANGAAVITRTSGNNAKLGSAGAAIAAYYVPAMPSRVVGLTGAGDSLVAGCISGLLDGADLGRSLHRGVAAASVVIQSPENVPETLSNAAVTAVGEQPGSWLQL